VVVRRERSGEVLTEPAKDGGQLGADRVGVVAAAGEGDPGQVDGGSCGGGDAVGGGLLVAFGGTGGDQQLQRHRVCAQEVGDVVGAAEVVPAGEQVSGGGILRRGVVAAVAGCGRVPVRVAQREVHRAVAAGGPAGQCPPCPVGAHPQPRQRPGADIAGEEGVVRRAGHRVHALLVVAEPGFAVDVGDDHHGGRHPVAGDRVVEHPR
jgi:hypothetical protein